MKKYNKLFFTLFVLYVLMPVHVLAKQVKINTPSNNVVIVELEGSDTIEAVKHKIYYQMISENEKYPISIEKQILYFDNKILEDGRTVDDYNIKADNTIFLGHKLEITLDANGGKYTDDDIYILDSWFSTSYDNLKVPNKEGYIFKDYYTEKIAGESLYDYLYYEQIHSDMTFYAQWVQTVDKIIIDFNNINNLLELNNNYDLFSALSFILSKNDMIIEKSPNEAANKNGKILFTINEQGDITLANNLTEEDNINYILTEEDKTLYLDDMDIESVPNEIEIIFSQPTYKVTLDANGGNFKDSDKYIIEKWDNEYAESLVVPKKDGYKFKGYFTEKNGGTQFEMILNESGIDSDMIFYAQWEEIIESKPAIPEEKNPNTFDDIGISLIIGTISLIGLIGATIYLKKAKN